MMDKKGQGLSTNAIILIIMGVAILVILIVGFTYVWEGIGSRIQKDNIGTIVSSCQTACSTQTVYDFCSKQNDLTDENGVKTTTSCQVLASVSDFLEYGLDPCPSIDCKVTCENLKVNDKAGATNATEGYDVTSIAYNLPAGSKCIIPK